MLQEVDRRNTRNKRKNKNKSNKNNKIMKIINTIAKHQDGKIATKLMCILIGSPELV